jgi:hypothetical protein
LAKKELLTVAKISRSLKDSTSIKILLPTNFRNLKEDSLFILSYFNNLP